MAKFNVFDALVEKGFEQGVDRFGRTFLAKHYEKEVEVLWYGSAKHERDVVVTFNTDRTSLTADYYDGFKRPYKTKLHLNDKRAYNAIVETIRNAEFEI